MKLFVGLGNPGKDFENTRHNIGFDVIDLFCEKNNIEGFKNKMNGKYTEYNHNGEKVILLKPQSYMNLSGNVVRQFIEYFKIDIEDVLIIVDDLDQPIGSFKLKKNSSSGGHNGLKDIERSLQTKDYKRLKIGISNDKVFDTKDYVLGKFSKKEREVIDEALEISTNIMTDFLNESFHSLCTKYNGMK